MHEPLNFTTATFTLLLSLLFGHSLPPSYHRSRDFCLPTLVWQVCTGSAVWTLNSQRRRRRKEGRGDATAVTGHRRGGSRDRHARSVRLSEGLPPRDCTHFEGDGREKSCPPPSPSPPTRAGERQYHTDGRTAA